VDWRLYRDIYTVSLHHHWLGTAFSDLEKVSIPLMIVLAAALWLLARPGGDRKWKLASGSAFTSAVVALIVNLVIHSLHDRPRPYEAHTISHPWSSSTDASFPSDHTTVSFAIAFAVLMFDTVAGVIFLVVAAIIGIGRLFIGAHYPGDVAAGVVVGGIVAYVVVRWLRGFASSVARYVERATDPVVTRIAR
jgi:undecaprenyl-diphosphatase